MERVTFQRADVKSMLSSMICLKFNANDLETANLVRRFRVEALPTLVILDPFGGKVYHDSGAPVPEGFAGYFAADRYNKAIGAYNAGNYEAMAPHAYFVLKWFGMTKLGKQIKKLCDGIKDDPKFTAAYKALEAKHQERLEAIKVRARKEKEKRRLIQAKLEKANALYKKYMRNAAFKLYRELILEHPRSPEANQARAVLKKHKKKWQEPASR